MVPTWGFRTVPSIPRTPYPSNPIQLETWSIESAASTPRGHIMHGKRWLTDAIGELVMAKDVNYVPANLYGRTGIAWRHSNLGSDGSRRVL